MCGFEGVSNFEEGFNRIRGGAEDLAGIAYQVGAKVVEVAIDAFGRTWTVLSATLDATTRVLKSPDGMKHALEAIVSLVASIRPLYILEIPQRLLQKIALTQFGISATRIFGSIKYFTNGRCEGGNISEQWRDGKVTKMLSEACFMIGRLGVSAKFLVVNRLVEFGAIAAQLANVPMFGAVFNAVKMAAGKISQNSIASVIMGSRYFGISGAFMAGIALLAPTRIESLRAGENMVYNVVDLANMVTEVTLMHLSMVMAANTHVLAVLGLVAAVTGIAAFLLEPATPPPPPPSGSTVQFDVRSVTPC